MNWGVCWGALALFSHVSLPLCCPARHEQRCWLSSARSLRFGYTKQAANCPRGAMAGTAQVGGLGLTRLAAAVAGRRSGALAGAVPCAAFLMEGIGNDQGCCFWQGDRVTLQIMPWGQGGAEQHLESDPGHLLPCRTPHGL